MGFTISTTGEDQFDGSRGFPGCEIDQVYSHGCGNPRKNLKNAHGAYISRVGLHGDPIELNVALAACLLGYGGAGLWLAGESERPVRTRPRGQTFTCGGSESTLGKCTNQRSSYPGNTVD